MTEFEDVKSVGLIPIGRGRSFHIYPYSEFLVADTSRIEFAASQIRREIEDEARTQMMESIQSGEYSKVYHKGKFYNIVATEVDIAA